MSRSVQERRAKSSSHFKRRSSMFFGHFCVRASLHQPRARTADFIDTFCRYLPGVFTRDLMAVLGGTG
jgi:hypothetical protein